MIHNDNLSNERAVLIAGATASGKSDLALELAETTGRAIVNADALQVYDGWRILTARPGAEELARAPHQLYGHVSYRASYSVGAWLRDLEPFLHLSPAPIIVGGTGLYFSALTEGLAEIPEIPASVRAEGDALWAEGGLSRLLSGLDASTLAKIDQANPARVQRAWEVQRTTGRGLADWQAATPPPVLPLKNTHAFLLDLPRETLTKRIEARFDQMLAVGAQEEARAMLPDWNPARLSSRAIGAAELIAHLKGEMSLDAAATAAKIASRQYAKRQRSWFRARMSNWHRLAH